MSETHTHWKKAFNKDYLGSHDLEPGQELKLTIKDVIVVDVTDPKGDKSPCNVARFTDRDVKPMILNATACKTIKSFTGTPYIEGWGGCNIQVFVQEVKAFGEIVDALRIRNQPPKMEKPVLDARHKRWPDAVKAYQEANDKEAKIESMRKHWQLADNVVALLRSTDA